MSTVPPLLNMRRLYNLFDQPVTAIDCGAKCTPYNPHAAPFCCDICTGIPVGYGQEWNYLHHHTDLWHIWKGDECAEPPGNTIDLRAETPEHLLLMACKGAAHCQREFRAMSCRQFPFFPYLTYDYRFVGLAYDWNFEPTCWVISHLEAVTGTYRAEFIRVYDELFSIWQEEQDSYAILSENMRITFSARRRRIPILHRNGGFYLLSPNSERMQRIPPDRLKRFGPYIEIEAKRFGDFPRMAE